MLAPEQLASAFYKSLFTNRMGQITASAINPESYCCHQELGDH